MAIDRSSDREQLVVRMAEDLLGPRSIEEVLGDRPTDTYLTGILWPQRTAMLGEDDDSLAAGAGGAADQDESEAAAVPATSVQKPSVAGVSFCVAHTDAPTVDVTCSFGRYRMEENGGEEPSPTPTDGAITNRPSGSADAAASAPSPPAGLRRQRRWKRSPVEIAIPHLALVPGSRFEELGPHNAAAEGVKLHIRCIDGGDRWLVTISLVNAVVAEEDREGMEAAALFQTSMTVGPGDGTLLVPRPARRGMVDPAEHADESAASLLFRNAHTFATGHTCSAEWQRSTAADSPIADWVRMSWLPSVVVPGVSSSGHRLFDRLRPKGDNADPLSARSLAEASGEDLLDALNALCDCYGDWIALQRAVELSGLDPDQLATATANLEACDAVLQRMRSAAAEICGDDDLRHAFQLANHVMYVQHSWDREKARSGELRWRPFQLAFLLLSAPSAVVPDHADRGVMDLLWFPTGGGKTEAYLALIAFVAMYRRLRTPAGGDGVSALMRYTLRLLTTQQFARSAAMILACEAVRSGRLEAPHSRRL
ncbi:MAG: DNA/RNA helicase, partial [Acidobacteriota bacterium]